MIHFGLYITEHIKCAQEQYPSERLVLYEIHSYVGILLLYVCTYTVFKLKLKG